MIPPAACTATSRLRRIAIVFVALLAACRAAGLSVVSPTLAQGMGSENTRLVAVLVWSKAAYAPGESAVLAVVMDIQPGWHVYPGRGSPDEDPTYLPTKIEVALPEGWTAGTVQWPAALETLFGPLGAQERLKVYEGRAIAYVPVAIPADAALGERPVEAVVHYQACDDQVCEMPTQARAVTTLVVLNAGEAANVPAPTPEQASLFANYRADGPPSTVDADAPTPQATTEPRDAGASEPAGPNWKELYYWVTFGFVAAAMGWMVLATFRITRKWSWRAPVALVGVLSTCGLLLFFRGLTLEPEIPWTPFTAAVFEEAQERGDKAIVIEFTADWCFNCKVLERTTLSDEEVIEALNAPSVATFRVDLTGPHPEGEALKEQLGGGGIPLTAVFRPGEEPVALRGNYTPTVLLNAISGQSGASKTGTHTFDILGWRFDVGMGAWAIVLLIAAVAGFLMNFTPCVLPVIPIKILSLQAHAKEPAKCFALGLVFGLGMVALFTAIGLLMVALIVGLDKTLDWGAIWSYWWVTIPVGAVVGFMGLGMLGLFNTNLPQFVYMFNPQSDSYLGSFLTGMFAAVLSTPCTGPLFGATIAWILLQPPLLGLLTFVVMGVGMAFPYVLLTAKPAWLAKLPKSGPGSELIKQVMGLLMLGVAAFFIGVGINGLVAQNATTATAAESGGDAGDEA